MDNYNYPMGSDTPDAPWNEHENSEAEVNILVTQTLEKHGITCYTTDYTTDEDGNDFSDTDWSKVVSENLVCNPLEIINEFGKVLDELSKTDIFSNKYISYWKEQCKGWIEKDLDVYED